MLDGSDSGEISAFSAKPQNKQEKWGELCFPETGEDKFQSTPTGNSKWRQNPWWSSRLTPCPVLLVVHRHKRSLMSQPWAHFSWICKHDLSCCRTQAEPPRKKECPERSFHSALCPVGICNPTFQGMNIEQSISSGWAQSGTRRQKSESLPHHHTDSKPQKEGRTKGCTEMTDHYPGPEQIKSPWKTSKFQRTFDLL